MLQRIRSGEFAPGDRLPTEKKLMEQYGVGRNSIREAVQALVTLGLVEVRPGRGATVIGIESTRALDAETLSSLLKEEAVEDLYAFRELLEVEIASSAARHASAEDLQQIERYAGAYQFAYSRGAPVGPADDEFHAALARASHNSVYAIVLDAVTGLIANARTLSERVPWAVERAAIDHQQIFEAVKARDPDSAADLMRRHIKAATEATRAGRRSLGSLPADGAGDEADRVSDERIRRAGSAERRRPRASR